LKQLEDESVVGLFILDNLSTLMLTEVNGETEL